MDSIEGVAKLVLGLSITAVLAYAYFNGNLAGGKSINNYMKANVEYITASDTDVQLGR